MIVQKNGQLLRIFIGENDLYEGIPLHEWIVNKACDMGLSGASVVRGFSGFGVHSHIHTAKILRLSSNLPIIIEIVDTKDKIDMFMPIIDAAISKGVATLQQVEIRVYQSNE